MKKPKGWIYVGQEKSGAVKIGWSSDPTFRLRELKLTPLAVFRGSRRDEAVLHRRFGEFALPERGSEWFTAAEVLLAFAKEKGVVDPISTRLVHVIPVRLAPEDVTKLNDAARACGRTPSDFIRHRVRVALGLEMDDGGAAKAAGKK